MNDLISRAAALDAVDGMKPMQGNMEQLAMKALCWAAVKTIPSVDAVPVVRCKDCKHRPIDRREEYNKMTGFGLEFPDSYCPCQCEDGWYNWFPGDDWYCANGERRND